MSMGFGCRTLKIYEDEQIVRYAYGAFNWNVKELNNYEREYDGEICIHKKAFLNDGRIILLVNTGIIQIKNSRFCKWKHKDGYDTIAIHWLCKLLRYMKEHTEFPEHLGYEV